MPGSRYKVRVTKDYLVFCSGHFITYAGDQCERIHGHNYRAAVEVEDDLDENHYVFDFIALQDLTRAIVDELDHRMLLPTESRLIRAGGGRAELAGPLPGPPLELPPRRVRPAAGRQHDGRAARRLHRRPPPGRDGAAAACRCPAVLRVEVEESFGQSAEVEWRRDDGRLGRGASEPIPEVSDPGRDFPRAWPIGYADRVWGAADDGRELARGGMGGGR